MKNTSVNVDEQRARIHEILDIVLDGNGIFDRKIEVTDDLPTVFFEFSGHIARVEVALYPDGWSPANPAPPHTYFDYPTDEPFDEGAIQYLRLGVANALKGKQVEP